MYALNLGQALSIRAWKGMEYFSSKVLSKMSKIINYYTHSLTLSNQIFMLALMKNKAPLEYGRSIFSGALVADPVS